MPGRGRILIGTSGYVYPHWRKGVFYPVGLRQREELAYYAARFPTLELNNPFYRLPTRDHFAHWAAQTPADFVFAVKASRYLSHLKRLADCREPVRELLDAARGLGPKLGVILCQLPPTFGPNLERLRSFLEELPHPAAPPWVFEFRHPGWLHEAVLRLLDGHGAGFCIPVGGRLRVEAIAATGPVGYVRFHAGRGREGRFTKTELARWADELEELAATGRPVYAYFNNDWQGFAPENAAQLGELVRA